MSDAYSQNDIIEARKRGHKQGKQEALAPIRKFLERYETYSSIRKLLYSDLILDEAIQAIKESLGEK